MNKKIENSTYQTWFKKFKHSKKEEKNSILERVIPLLTSLFGIYDKCNIFQRHAIIRAVFKDNLAYGRGVFRINYINPMPIHKTLYINNK